jgi:hypothetical protein
MQEKIKRITYPKGFSVIPALIHVNDVSEQLEDCGGFSYLMDFDELFL